MYLSRKRILELVQDDQHPLFEEFTFIETSLKQASCDLRVGSKCFVVGDDFPQTLSTAEPYVILRPGQFAFLTTHEILHLPYNIIGFISLRSTYKNKGLINISGFHVDPTFRGRLTFAVQNIGPSDLRIRYLEPTFTLFLAEVDAKIPEDTGDPRPPLEDDPIPLSLVQNLGGSTVTLSKLQKEIDEVKTKLLIYAPLALAALVPLLLFLMKEIHDRTNH